MNTGQAYRSSVKWFLRAVYLVFAAVLMGSGYGLYLAWQLFTPVGPQEYKTFVLERGAGAYVVSEQLQEQGFIRNAFAFRLLLKATRTADKLQPGHHTLSPSMTSLQVRDELMKVVQAPGVKVTVPEGKRLVEVAEIVHRAIPRFTAKDFLAFTLYPRNTFPDKKYLPEAGIEGYLFPDTYEFEKPSDPSATARPIVDRMLTRFEEVVLALPEVKAKKFPGGLTFHQVMILASMVEAEAQVAKDRPLIAGVYLNRLKQGMRLECDATVMYGLHTRQLLSTADLRRDSPYNTYLHEGLPPGPICNPGRSSIEAALHPKGDYLFYVKNDKKGDGSHVFARTYSEHLDNIRRYSRP
jgi:UPF0755 protein